MRLPDGRSSIPSVKASAGTTASKFQLLGITKPNASVTPAQISGFFPRR